MVTRRHIRGTETSLTPVREKFGGFDVPASLTGMVVALGFLILIGALAGGIAAALGYRLEPVDLAGDPSDVVVMGAIGALLALLAAFLLGGWSAGRMARYDGGINGLAAGLWALVMVVVLALVGAWVGAEYDAFDQAGIPEWLPGLTEDSITGPGVVAAVVAVAVILAGGFLGGKAGEVYHRKADAALTDGLVRDSARPTPAPGYVTPAPGEDEPVVATPDDEIVDSDSHPDDTIVSDPDDTNPSDPDDTTVLADDGRER